MNKKMILFSLSVIALLSCDRSSNIESSVGSIQLAPRVTRNASVSDSVFDLAATVHVALTTTNGTPLLNDTLAFSKHASPTVLAPSDQGVNVRVEGLSNTNVVLWSGSTTLPPTTADTSFAVTVDMVSMPSAGGSASLGTLNTPSFDSINVASWASADTFDKPIHAFFSCTTPGAILHYTLDGTYPTIASSVYDKDTGILIDSSANVQVIATESGWTNSATILHKVVLQAQPASISSISATAWTTNTYDHPVTVKLTSATPKAEIHYTLDGTQPTQSSTVYTSAGILIDSTRTLTAAVYKGKNQSNKCLSQLFVLQAGTPTASTYTGHYSKAFSDTLTSSENATIYYTLDGGEPTRQSNKYVSSAPLMISSDAMLKVRSFGSGNVAPSAIVSYSYSFDHASMLAGLFSLRGTHVDTVTYSKLKNSYVATLTDLIRHVGSIKWNLASSTATSTYSYQCRVNGGAYTACSDSIPIVVKNVGLDTVNLSVIVTIASSKATTTDTISFSETSLASPGMRSISGGTFVMGCALDTPLCASDEMPVHSVTVSRFMMDTLEFGNGIYSYFSGGAYAIRSDTLPAAQISWTDAVRMCNLRSAAEGYDAVYSNIVSDNSGSTPNLVEQAVFS